MSQQKHQGIEKKKKNRVVYVGERSYVASLSKQEGNRMGTHGVKRS